MASEGLHFLCMCVCLVFTLNMCTFIYHATIHTCMLYWKQIMKKESSPNWFRVESLDLLRNQAAKVHKWSMAICLWERMVIWTSCQIYNPTPQCNLTAGFHCFPQQIWVLFNNRWFYELHGLSAPMFHHRLSLSFSAYTTQFFKSCLDISEKLILYFSQPHSRVWLLWLLKGMQNIFVLKFTIMPLSV